MSVELYRKKKGGIEKVLIDPEMFDLATYKDYSFSEVDAKKGYTLTSNPEPPKSSCIDCSYLETIDDNACICNGDVSEKEFKKIWKGQIKDCKQFKANANKKD